MMSSLFREYVAKRGREITATLRRNSLWKRILKNTVATTLAIAIGLIHYDTSPIFGKAAYLAAMVTVFGHPGRRFGQLVEALVMVLIGLAIGLTWSALGIWLSSLVIHSNPPAAYGIRAVFFVLALMFHGFFRSRTPRVFVLVLVVIIQTLTALTTTTTSLSAAFVAQLVYPMLMAVAVVFIVNLVLFPEFSASYLGQTTIDNLDSAAKSLKKAGCYFVGYIDLQNKDEKLDKKMSTELPRIRKEMSRVIESDKSDKAFSGSVHGRKPRASSNSTSAKGDGPVTQGHTVMTSLAELTASKDDLRSKLAATRNAQNETQFEAAYAHIPPHLLAPVSKKSMKKLVTHIIAVIGACESRFALLGEETIEKEAVTEPAAILVETRYAQEVNLRLLKPKKEIEFGDVRLLRYLLAKIKDPYIIFQDHVLQAIDIAITCIAYSYDVQMLPSKTKTPSSLPLAKLEEAHASFKTALENFDSDVTKTLESAAILQDLHQEDLDIMPREEIFLIASFLLNIRQAAIQISDMLEILKLLVQQRAEASKWRRLYLPNIRWKKWLRSGGETDESLPVRERRATRQPPASKETTYVKNSISRKSALNTAPNDSELGYAQSAESKRENQCRVQSVKVKTTSLSNRIRNSLADILDWLQTSEDFSYALKLTLATFLVSFPAFIPSLNAFYSQKRGSWAALQLIFVFDVAIGTSIWNAYIRAIGTTLGSLWGWAAYAAGNGDPYICTAMLFIAMLPSNYVQLGSQYAKAGIVTITSMAVVALATEFQTVPGTSTENFLSRWIAFMIGSFVALGVEMLLLPVKARTRLVESLAATIRRIGEMESCVGYGIEDGATLKGGFPPHVFKSFEKASNKAKISLDDADTFFPFCNSEPRLKGSFKSVAKVYEEIIFVLRQVVDKMDNMIQLRLAYGSGPLEEFNPLIYPYRRNVAGAISLILYAVHEALITKFPLPQFMPSARLAHLRLINRIREVVQRSISANESENAIVEGAIKRTLRRKYMSWNASSAAQAEIIEYLEELTDLVKLIVGANEFRSGLLARPTLQEYARATGHLLSPIKSTATDTEFPSSNKEEVDIHGELTKTTSPDLPLSLQRIQSRKHEAALRRRQKGSTLAGAPSTN